MFYKCLHILVDIYGHGKFSGEEKEVVDSIFD